MCEFEPTLEDSQFLSDLRKQVRANPSLYRAAGDWLDQEFSAEACWRKEIEQVKRHNRKFPPPQYPKQEPREKRNVTSKLSRIVAAVNHFVHGDTVLVTAPRWDHASRLLLLCWILTDETAHEFTPRLSELQRWSWDDDDSGQQFSRLWSQAVLPNPADWRKWLDMCRKAWVARPETDVSNPPEDLKRIADALEQFALKVGVCLMPDDPKWADNSTAQSVLFNLKCWQSGNDDNHNLPPHLVAGMSLKIKVAHKVDLILDRLPNLASRFHDDFNGLWTGFDHLIDEFKQSRDTCDESLGKMLAVALRAEKLADRVRKAAEQIQKTPAYSEQFAPQQYVTLDQAGARVGRSKRTLEKYKGKGLPEPDIQGKGGKPHEWLWDNIRPWLEKTFGRQLPEILTEPFRAGADRN